MQFWFCETCGKRLTDRDLAAGTAHNKKAKGIFCKSCAVGVTTIEFEAIDPSQLGTNSVKQHERAPATPGTGSESPPTDASPRHKARAPRPATPVNDRSRILLTKNRIAIAIIIAGVSVFVAGVFVACLLMSKSETPAIRPEQPAKETKATPPVEAPATRAPAAVPASDSAKPAAHSSAGLIAWWKLDETSGTAVADASGHGHTGTLVNGPAWTAGRIGGALLFDHAGAYVDLGLVPQHSELTLSQSDSTICLWVKPSESHEPYERLLDKSDGPYAHGGYAVALAGTAVQVYVNGLTLTGSVTLPAGVWSHVAVIFSNSGCRIFINGQQDQRLISGAPQRPPDAAVPLKLGVMNSHGERNFKGGLDDVRIYNRALSALELKELAAVSETGNDSQGSENFRQP